MLNITTMVILGGKIFTRLIVIGYTILKYANKIMFIYVLACTFSHCRPKEKLHQCLLCIFLMCIKA